MLNYAIYREEELEASQAGESGGNLEENQKQFEQKDVSSTRKALGIDTDDEDDNSAAGGCCSSSQFPENGSSASSAKQAEMIRREQLQACIDYCGSFDAGLELLDAIESVKVNKASALGVPVLRSMKELSAGKRFRGGGGLTGMAMAAVPSAVDRILPPDLLLGSFHRSMSPSPTTAAAGAADEAQARAYAGSGDDNGIAQTELDAMQVRCLRPMTSNSIELSDGEGLAAGNAVVVPEEHLGNDPLKAPSPDAAPVSDPGT